MTEDEAREWVRTRFGVSRETLLAQFGEMVRDESAHQNLISKATLDAMWDRHIVDSAQLLTLAPDEAKAGLWIDIGTGAGFPGIVAAALREAETVLVEPRRRRAEFLQRCVDALGIGSRTQIVAAKIERYSGPKAAIISARAVAALPDLFAAARHCSRRDTIWLLPKGASAQSEVEAARDAWQGSFHVEQSITHPESRIVVAREVRRK
ncbi:16S rRNA (guanine(527)-N(7))-methyltransferase RsmG [Stakelama marina]|uniref:Ribosomal RNA small subunit methyltransferase G n=1 Tax=Stakelama marina TaxID=2826939 RepID=A0A8T4IEL1_9SPHN|nr:RsmG family class I SAM-dependent methyltransferase [Stakelama marina]MBR0552993.1 16S rRNA (guanine(527)-N(7))-methyltransferase RsmG [Stakelama marina]